MTLCPIARAVHCTGCPLVRFCLVRRLFGDYGTYVPLLPGKLPEIRVNCPHGPTRPKAEGSDPGDSKSTAGKRCRKPKGKRGSRTPGSHRRIARWELN